MPPQKKPAAKPEADTATDTSAEKPAAATSAPETTGVQHIGHKADPNPNHAHTLLSGPDSPGPADVQRVSYSDLIKES